MFFLVLSLTLLAGCSDSSSNNSTAPLSANNVNLIFVSSPDLAYQAAGDVDPNTANLTSQGLQRSLRMAPYLKQQVLGGNNVTAIYALSPMTHLQTANNYPDMTAIGYIQQFALLNQITLPVSATSTYTANSYPVNVSYAQGSVPNGVAVPAQNCPNCTGLDFNNTNNNNDALAYGIIDSKVPGYYVFSAPWETISALLTGINTHYGYNLNIPTSYMGPNHVYAISIPASGSVSLVTYSSNLNPPATYPVLPAPVQSAACTNSQQPYFSTLRIGGVDGVTVPANINKNQRVYIIRHADAHPDTGYHFENGNFVGAGQWRSLALSNALNGKISPNMVYSIDPAQWFHTIGTSNYSYVRPSLTVLPYAIANKLPFYLASSFSLTAGAGNDPVVAQNTSDFFFTGGNLSNQTILLAWESQHIKPLINALLSSYGGNNLPLLPTNWPSPDYDTIWTVKLDAQGNLTVDNELCEGIDSSALPGLAPQF